MEKKLPIIMPPIETYQSSSFILGIILANSNIENVFYNNYINLVCNNTNKMWDVELQFANVSWEDFRRNGIAEMDMYYLKNLSSDKYVDFIKERIDQGNYILLYSIDEFFLSYTINYQKRHFIHDTYIYGYNTDSFFIMAYKEKKLQMLEISIEEIVEGMYSYFQIDNDANFCTFRPFHAISVQVDFDKMMKEIMSYAREYKSYKDAKVYGINIYSILEKCILFIAEGKTDEYDGALDLRVFRMLWEHKKILVNHIKKIKEKKKLDEQIIAQIIEIEQAANKVFLLSMKYNVTYKKEILYKILGYLEEVREKEIIFFKQLITVY